MIVRVLGSAAGGGVPQWNCACPNCGAARQGRAPRRTQASLAISEDGARWLLLNVSPDVTQHIEAFPPLQPSGVRGTPIIGALITDANVDHLGGLAHLRQEGPHRFTIRSSALVRAIAVEQPAFAAFAHPPHAWLETPLDDGAACAPRDIDDPVGHEWIVRAIPVPGLAPGFAGRRAERGAVVAYEIEVRSGARLLYAPVFSTIDRPLADAARRADIVFLDGSFHDDDEMDRMGLGRKRARDLGHQPVSGGTLAFAATLSNRRLFTHLNNSNPLLDPSSPAARAVREAGCELAEDGLEIHLT